MYRPPCHTERPLNIDKLQPMHWLYRIMAHKLVWILLAGAVILAGIGIGGHMVAVERDMERTAKELEAQHLIALEARIAALEDAPAVKNYLLESLTNAVELHLAEKSDYTAEEVSRLLVYQDGVMTDLGLKVEDLGNRLGRLEERQ